VYEAIRKNLETLRTANVRPNVFGSQSHSFRLHPTLSLDEVRAFETKHRIVLPSDYREFLMYVGNGGAGPYYGLFKLGEMDSVGSRHGPWTENDGFVGILSERFPHAEAWNDLTGRPSYDESRETHPEWEDEYNRLRDEWNADHYWNTRWVNGAIPICHLGCALRQWVVITGPEAGHVWGDDRVDERGLYPLQKGALKRITFLQWYRSWLDEAMEAVRKGRNA
jgi:hypothetical protein